MTFYENLVDLIKKGEINQAWKLVRGIGIDIVPDDVERYLIFNRTISDFDVKKSKSLISLYKSYLRGFNLSTNSTFRLTNSKSVIQALKNEQISPNFKETRKKPVFDGLKKWHNSFGE